MTPYDPNIAKSHEPLTITADQIAGFLERCNRPRAAAWVDDLGGNYDRALQTIKELRTQLNDVCNRLQRYEPPQGLPPRIPTDYRSKCE